MLEMKYFLLLIPLIHHAWGQGAPDDFSSRCNHNRDYASDVVVLFDSYRYESLYDVQDNLWILRDSDGDTKGWVALSGVCTPGLSSSTTADGQDQDNWAFSQYIQYLDAKEVFANITYQFFSVNSFITVYREDSNNSALTNAQRIQESLYDPIVGGNAIQSRLVQSEDRTSLTSVLSFTRPSDWNGFYLAFRDRGIIIVTLRRIIIYYLVAEARTDGLLVCPAVPLPPMGGTSVGTCSCAINSAPVSGVSLDTTCNHDGMCSGGQWCACLPGYQLQNNQACVACPEGMFKHLHDNSTCLPCPVNSENRGTNNSVCACIPPNIRNPNDPSAPCTTPPSSPRLILGKGGLPIVDGDITTVCWLPALDKGGLDDLRYNVYIFNVDEDMPTYTRLNPAEGVVQQGNDDNARLCYDAKTSGFQQNYGILVVSTNGATASTDGEVITNVEDVQGRSVAFFVAGSPASTSASVAGPVAATFFVTAIVAAVVAAVVTALIMLFLCGLRRKETHSSNGMETDSYKMKSTYNNVPPPSKAPPVHGESAPYKPRPPQPPRPAPRKV